MRRLKIGDRLMRVRDEGESKKLPLLFIHGAGSSSVVWMDAVRRLQHGRRVLAPDLPGHGQSDRWHPPADVSIAMYRDAVGTLCAQLALDLVILVGHSMGGQIALTHALRYPGRAERLVLVAPAGFERFGRGEGSWLAEAVDKEFVAKTPPEAVYANVAANFYSMPKEARFMVDDRLRVVGGPDFDAYAYAVARSVYAMVHEPVIDRLSQIRVPVLVVFGEDDGLIPNPILHGGKTRDVAEGGTRLLPRGRLVMIPRAGHMVQFERPAEFDAALLHFLEEAP